jgi:hypothetical protein
MVACHKGTHKFKHVFRHIMMNSESSCIQVPSGVMSTKRLVKAAPGSQADHSRIVDLPANKW